MTCREFVEFLIDYLDDTLADGVRSDFQNHLAECPGCVAFLNSYQSTIRSSKDAFLCDDLAVAENVPEELIHAVMASLNRHDGC